jgi:hypothetical protein
MPFKERFMHNQESEIHLAAFADHLLRNQLADDRHARYKRTPAEALRRRG